MYSGTWDTEGVWGPASVVPSAVPREMTPLVEGDWLHEFPAEGWLLSNCHNWGK